MDPILSPWTVFYADGAGNLFRFAGGGVEGASVVYDPVTPAESSSGTYSGGTPRTTELGQEAVQRLWHLVERCEMAMEDRSPNRAKGTGLFTVTVGESSREFILVPGGALEAFETFVSAFRGPVSDEDEASVLRFEGVAHRAKVGPLLATEDDTIWVDLPGWPDEAIGRRVIVRGRWTTRKDLPVFIPDDGPARAGIPVPFGTDLDKASTRRVLTDIEWEFAE